MHAASDPGRDDFDTQVQEEVRRFYDSVGWTKVGAGVFQNARYEDLRPVSQEYIRRCRRRVLRHLPAGGTYLLDAGSGPIQYPEYLEYSAGYRFRVCLDLSALALREARERIGRHGLYVLGDIARLPFVRGFVDGAVSMHTVHHLPLGEQPRAFEELERVLRPGATAVVVYGWGRWAPIDTWTRWPVRIASALLRMYQRLRGRVPEGWRAAGAKGEVGKATRTFKHGYGWLRENTSHLAGVEVLVWRSVSTNFLRALIHERLFGRWCLRLLYALEERAPRWFGRFGQYPLIVIRTPHAGDTARHEG
jgi:SAM-dependent methyltransferase